MDALTQNEFDEVIHSVDGNVNWEQESRLRGERIRKIVVGGLDGEDDASPVPGDRLPAEIRNNFAKLFPNLTHLYLWRIQGLEELPTLPVGLVCLDVRGCPALRSFGQRTAALPHSLEQLVVQSCPELPFDERHVASVVRLKDLVLRDAALDDRCTDAILRASSCLELVDLSGCARITTIGWLPASVTDLRLDRCERLRDLPGRWPRKLRRLSLRGAKSVKKVADLPPTLDFVDFVGAESLEALPPERGRPRSLFLYGSGVRVPPASEHGRSADENVAARTDAYFRDVALVGEGSARRCKVLLLGNGHAGKTTLALALDPEGDPTGATALGTTHGVRFQDLPTRLTIDGLVHDVNVHVWDFGGQEIYHNTHRLFIEKGAIFVVVWDPTQDGKQPSLSPCGYQDVWRPLQYWIDFIRLSSRNPRMVVVCNRRPGLRASDAELMVKFRKELPRDSDQIPLFISDVSAREGAFGELKKRLQSDVGEILATQGTAVPSYWEIAQKLVERWTRRMQGDAAFTSPERQMSSEAFGERLWQAIGEALSEDPEGRYWKLSEAIQRGSFRLGEDDRVRRTLEFLTNSGWLYWDEKLFEGRVIVGQEWALRGIYAALDRTHESEVYGRLAQSNGQFTRRLLAELCWSKDGQPNFSELEQDLLCTYMVQCGLAFVLRSERESWRSEAVYVAFEYLPDAGSAGIEAIYRRRIGKLSNATDTIEHEFLHRLHWNAFLIEAGAEFGASADFANDGFHVETKEGAHFLYRLHLKPGGLGGWIEVKAAGENCEGLLRAAVSRMRRHLPNDATVPVSDRSIPLGTQKRRLSVFLSYAWNRPEGDSRPAPSPPYEAPVDAIEAMLGNLDVRVVRDRRVTSEGDNITEFMVSAAKSDRVIIIHSDKYCESPDCIFELKHVVDQLAEEERRSFKTAVIPVEHPTSRIGDVDALGTYLEYWRGYQGSVPNRLRWNRDALRDHACASLRDFSARVSALNSTNIAWRDDGAAALGEIRARIVRALVEMRGVAGERNS